MTMNKKQAMHKRIDDVCKRAKASQNELAKLSRDILSYLYDDFAEHNGCNDIGAVNRFIDGLRPVDRRVALQFFPKHCGWIWDKHTHTFGKRMKDKVYQKRLDLAKTELENPKFDMYEWYEREGEKPPAKKRDHVKLVGNAIAKGFADEENPLTLVDIVKILHAGDHDLRKIMKACEACVALQDLEG